MDGAGIEGGSLRSGLNVSLDLVGTQGRPVAGVDKGLADVRVLADEAGIRVDLPERKRLARVWWCGRLWIDRARFKRQVVRGRDRLGRRRGCRLGTWGGSRLGAAGAAATATGRVVDGAAADRVRAVVGREGRAGLGRTTWPGIDDGGLRVARDRLIGR